VRGGNKLGIAFCAVFGVVWVAWGAYVARRRALRQARSQPPD
jgi:hypothetical protein